MPPQIDLHMLLGAKPEQERQARDALVRVIPTGGSRSITHSQGQIAIAHCADPHIKLGIDWELRPTPPSLEALKRISPPEEWPMLERLEERGGFGGSAAGLDVVTAQRDAHSGQGQDGEWRRLYWSTREALGKLAGGLAKGRKSFVISGLNEDWLEQAAVIPSNAFISKVDGGGPALVEPNSNGAPTSGKVIGHLIAGRISTSNASKPKKNMAGALDTKKATKAWLPVAVAWLNREGDSPVEHRKLMTIRWQYQDQGLKELLG